MSRTDVLTKSVLRVHQKGKKKKKKRRRYDDEEEDMVSCVSSSSSTSSSTWSHQENFRIAAHMGWKVTKMLASFLRECVIRLLVALRLRDEHVYEQLSDDGGNRVQGVPLLNRTHDIVSMEPEKDVMRFGRIVNEEEKRYLKILDSDASKELLNPRSRELFRRFFINTSKAARRQMLLESLNITENRAIGEMLRNYYGRNQETSMRSYADSVLNTGHPIDLPPPSIDTLLLQTADEIDRSIMRLTPPRLSIHDVRDATAEETEEPTREENLSTKQIATALLNEALASVRPEDRVRVLNLVLNSDEDDEEEKADGGEMVAAVAAAAPQNKKKKKKRDVQFYASSDEEETKKSVAEAVVIQIEEGGGEEERTALVEDMGPVPPPRRSRRPAADE